MKDINDNAPAFDSSIYIAVVLENVVPETSVLNVSAHDPDEGSAGLVHYKLIDEQQLNGIYFKCIEFNCIFKRMFYILKKVSYT